MNIFLLVTAFLTVATFSFELPPILENEAILKLLEVELCPGEGFETAINSTILGDCHKDLVKLHSETDGECGKLFCIAIRKIKEKKNLEDIRNMLSDQKAFKEVMTNVIKPFMEQACNSFKKGESNCLLKLFDALTSCPSLSSTTLIEAVEIGYLVENKEVMKKTRQLLEKISSHMCRSTQTKKVSTPCYLQIIKTLKTIKTWHDISIGLDIKGLKNNKKYPKTCDKFKDVEEAKSLSEIMNFLESIDLCREKCKKGYKERLMGCCVKGVVNDDSLEEAMNSLHESFQELTEKSSALRFDFTRPLKWLKDQDCLTWDKPCNFKRFV